MPDPLNEQRRSDRFETDVKVYFHYPYDINTKVDYQLTDQKREKFLSPKYEGISKNVSAEGLCFHSSQELRDGDNLLIEVHLPGDASAIAFEATVRWCQSTEKEAGFDTGVKLITVNGQSVTETIHFDQMYHIEWSAVLEAILGKYRILTRNRQP